MSIPAGALTPPARVGSIPATLLLRAHERGSEVALRDKHRGRWRETTWAQHAQRVARVGLALAELGTRPGDRVAILARNRPEWIVAELAIQGIGCVSVGVAPASPASEVRSVLAHSEARVLIAEDEEQLDKALEVRDRLPALERIVVMDAAGVREPDDPALATFSELEHAVPVRHAVEDWASHVEGVDPESVATIAYTAGRTGRPKGVMLTHENLAWAGTTLRRAIGAGPDDELLSHLPLPHVVERVASVGVAVASGCVVNFGAGGASLPQDLREVQPTIFLADPGVWEKMLAGVHLRMAAASRAKRAAYTFGVSHRGRAGNALLRRLLLEKLGLSRVHAALSVAAPTAPAVVKSFRALGVEVRELYGLTESTFVCTLAPPGEGRPGTVGRGPAGVAIRIVSDDEILVRSPGVFAGYYDDEEATQAVLDADGWLRTGDRGMFDSDGFLTLT